MIFSLNCSSMHIYFLSVGLSVMQYKASFFYLVRYSVIKATKEFICKGFVFLMLNIYIRCELITGTSLKCSCKKSHVVTSF